MSHAPQYHVPDFEADAKLVADYQDAKDRFERREILDAEAELRSEFTKKREALRAELAVAGQLIEERRVKALRALEEYGARYRHRVAKGKPLKPSTIENLFSFGAASKLYARAMLLSMEVENAQTQRRRKEHEDEVLDDQLKRRLAASESALKIKHTSAEGIANFHKRPGMAEMWDKVQAIRAERESYASRLGRGDVSFAEQRDRDWAEKQIARLEAPFSGALAVRIACYGNFSYFIVRDLERHEYALTYDPRLDAFSETVIDVYRIADRFEVKAHKGDKGRAYTPIDHFAAGGKSEEAARDEFRKGRTALRELSGLREMTVEDESERQLIELLVAFFSGVSAPASSAGAAITTTAPPSAAAAAPEREKPLETAPEKPTESVTG